MQSKCNACGNINNLDSLNKAGAYLIKNLPKSDGGEFTPASAEDMKKSKKVKNEDEDKKEEEEKEKPVETLD